MEAFKRVYPTEFHEKFLAGKVRPDGRQLEESRQLELSVGTCHARPAEDLR